MSSLVPFNRRRQSHGQLGRVSKSRLSRSVSRSSPKNALKRLSVSRSAALPTPVHRDLIVTPRTRQNFNSVFSLIVEIDDSPSVWVRHGTMESGGIEELIEGSAAMGNQIANDHLLRDALEIKVLTFGSAERIKTLTAGFEPAKSFQMPKIPMSTCGTPLCEMRCRSVLEAIEYSRRMRLDHDRRVRPAWIISFTDGKATDASEEKLEAARLATKEADSRGIMIFPIAVGSSPDFDMLEELSQPGRPARHIREVRDFLVFFKCLFSMLRSRSTSRPGDLIVPELNWGDGPEWEVIA